MKVTTIVGAALSAIVLIGIPVGAASASTPSPTNPPAATANEFAVPSNIPAFIPGEALPIQPTPEAWQQELTAIAREHHASSVTIDASTGTILSVSDLGFATADLFTVPAR
jgi:hypothetical protein